MSYNNFRSLGKNRYKNAVEVLRKYTTDIFTPSQGFNLKNIDNLSRSQKSKIRRYFKELSELTARPYEPVKVKDKKKLIAVQKAAQHQKLLGKFNVAFIPSDGVNKPKIIYGKNNQISFRLGKITRQVINVDPEQLSLFPDETIQRIIDDTPDAKAYRIQCGKYEYNTKTFVRGYGLADQIKKFQQKYSNSDEWLHGVIAYYYDNTRQIADFTNHVRQEREKLQKARRAQKSRLEYQKQKEAFQKQYGARLEKFKNDLTRKK